MFEDLLKYEKNKKITDEDIVEVKKIIAADKMKFTYFQLMHEKQNDFKDRERFENMRFYYLNLNKIINYLQVSFLNVYYYQKIYNSISSREKLYRLSDVVFYEELYFYYFFIMVDNIFKIIDKTGILLNDCLNLEISLAMKNMIEREDHLEKWLDIFREVISGFIMARIRKKSEKNGLEIY